MQIVMQITEIDKAGRSDFFLLRTCGMKKYEMLKYRPDQRAGMTHVQRSLTES
mgnify:CR=1 FL=1